MRHTLFSKIISVENLFLAWQEFEREKKEKMDVQIFSLSLMDNIMRLHEDLLNKKYACDPYYAFTISDPKPRSIHKASVRDRLLHRAIYRIMYRIFDPGFIFDSYSCRLGKGTHAAMNRFKVFARRASQNNTKTAWVLKCDIKKFFASMDQDVLLSLISKKVSDRDTLELCKIILESFDSGIKRKGLPLGNITSQVFSNVYMNELDQFVKHRLRVKYYIRYADDFVFLSSSKEELNIILLNVTDFLNQRLKLSIHPQKIYLKTLASGVDFLGFVHFPHHKILRPSTYRRLVAKIELHPEFETFQSYLGLMKHGDTFKLQKEVENWFWLNQPK